LAEKTAEQASSDELRTPMVVKLYQLGRLSSGRAAELAGMSRVEFLLSLGRYRVFPLDAELVELEQRQG
jgi:predicted HTH domain antitoxin